MKKIFSILALSIIFSIIIKFNYIQGKSVNVDKVIVSALNSVEADLFSSSFDFKVQLNSKLDSADIKEMIKNMAADLSLNNKSLEWSENYSDSQGQIYVRGQDESGIIVTIKGDMAFYNKEKRKNHLAMNFYNDKAIDLEETKNRVNKVFLSYKLKPQISMYIIGTINKKFNDSELKQIENKILEEYIVNNTDVETKEKVFAYSPTDGKSETIDKDAANINVTFNYSSEDKKTYIYIETKSRGEAKW